MNNHEGTTNYPDQEFETVYYHPIKDEEIPIEVTMVGCYIEQDSSVGWFNCGYDDIEYELDPEDEKGLTDKQLKEIYNELFEAGKDVIYDCLDNCDLEDCYE